MSNTSTKAILERPFLPVKSKAVIDTPHSPDSMIHHNCSSLGIHERKLVHYGSIGARYGVSPTYRILSPGILLKKFDYIRDCLRVIYELTPAQVYATMELLRLWAYYGQVYPKASQIAGEAEISDRQTCWRAEQGLGAPPRTSGCSRATFWRTIKLLEELGLIQVVNRFVVRPHAQISNLYRLDRLVQVIARYLADHGSWLWGKWLEPILAIPNSTFWSYGPTFELPVPRLL